MRVGIIAEGPGDLAVLVNVLRGALGIDFEDVQFLRPEYALDETDLHNQPVDRFSNWELVKAECVACDKITEFLESPIEDERLVVIHLDTAEAERAGYDVARPTRGDAGYAAELRQRVIAKIDAWLTGRHAGFIRHAVAIEETDAWVLTIFSTKDTTARVDPKKDLEKALNKPNALTDKERKRLFQLNAYRKYEKLSDPLRKRKKLDECARRNQSLKDFVDSLPVADPSASAS